MGAGVTLMGSLGVSGLVVHAFSLVSAETKRKTNDPAGEYTQNYGTKDSEGGEGDFVSYLARAY